MQWQEGRYGWGASQNNRLRWNDIIWPGFLPMSDLANRFKGLTRLLPARFSGETVPLALAGVLLVAFGLLIKDLGFYQDDWNPVYYGSTRGLDGLWELYLADGRPFGSLLYHWGFQLLGFVPLLWHLLSLFLRFLTVLFTWLSLREIWPAHTRQITWVVLLFAIYPLFSLQPLAVTYSIHWTGYLLFSISIWAMVRSVRRPAHYWLYLLLSMVTGGLHLILVEYYTGIELIRPVLLWLLFYDANQSVSKRLVRTLKNWAPFLFELMIYAIYRIYWIPRLVDTPNTPTMIGDFFHTPIATLLELFQVSLQDLVVILFSSWSQVLNPQIFEITRSVNLKALAIALTAGLVLYYYLAHLSIEDDERLAAKRNWAGSAFWIGVILTWLGPIPGWLTRQGLTQNNLLWSSRFGLASIIGASLVIVSLLELLITNRKHRMIIFSLLIALSVGWHIRNSNEFRWAWVKETRFYQQLFWRAPYIEPGTAILSDGEIFPFMGEYPTSFALGTLYPRLESLQGINYWFFGLHNHFEDNLDRLIQGVQIEDAAYTSVFSGNSLDSLVIYFEPEKNQCLWVLRPEDGDIRILPDITRRAVAISNLNRIRSSAQRPFLTDIFGMEDTSTWCYYFEKADLARQFSKWDEVVNLWKGALKAGYTPGNGVEYLPFIEGFAHVGDWKTAEKMTLQANAITRMMGPILCSTWGRIKMETESSEVRDAILSNLNEKLSCP